MTTGILWILMISPKCSAMVKTFEVTEESPPGDIASQVPDGHFTSFASLQEYTKYLSMEKLRFPKDMARKSSTTSDLTQYDLIKTLGQGAFGKVFLAKSKKNNTYVVLKCLSKDDIVNKKLLHQVLNEKQIMSSLRFNFVLNMIETFIDNSYVYFAMPYLSGGDLLIHLNNVRRFDEQVTKLYVAQVVLALDYLHTLKIAHRDLKPENLSLDGRGFLRLLDFGLSKVIMGKTRTFCGTPEYIAPEIIQGHGYGFSVDWWSLGIVAYFLCSGIQPFFASQQDRLFHLITSGDFVIREFFSPDFADVIKQLICVDINKRVGCGKGGAEDVKKLKWFNDMNWLGLLNKKLPMLYRPKRDMFGLVNFLNFQEEPLVVASQNAHEDVFGDF